MTQRQKLIAKILTGTSDANIGFDEIINIQPNGNKAKAYQVKQVREIIVKYNKNINDCYKPTFNTLTELKFD